MYENSENANGQVLCAYHVPGTAVRGQPWKTISITFRKKANEEKDKHPKMEKEKTRRGLRSGDADARPRRGLRSGDAVASSSAKTITRKKQTRTNVDQAKEVEEKADSDNSFELSRPKTKKKKPKVTIDPTPSQSEIKSGDGGVENRKQAAKSTVPTDASDELRRTDDFVSEEEQSQHESVQSGESSSENDEEGSEDTDEEDVAKCECHKPVNQFGEWMCEIHPLQPVANPLPEVYFESQVDLVINHEYPGHYDPDALIILYDGNEIFTDLKPVSLSPSGSQPASGTTIKDQFMKASQLNCIRTAHRAYCNVYDLLLVFARNIVASISVAIPEMCKTHLSRMLDEVCTCIKAIRTNTAYMVKTGQFLYRKVNKETPYGIAAAHVKKYVQLYGKYANGCGMEMESLVKLYEPYVLQFIEANHHQAGRSHKMEFPKVAQEDDFGVVASFREKMENMDWKDKDFPEDVRTYLTDEEDDGLDASKPLEQYSTLE